MEKDYTKREDAVKSGYCPDCGSKLRKISAKEYSPLAEEGEGTFFRCSSELTEEQKAVGKRPCVFKTYLHDEPPKPEAA